MGRIFGVYAIVEGALVIVAGVRQTRRKGLFIAEGTSGIVAGLVALAFPAIIALVLLYVVALWAFVTGVLEIIAAFYLRREIEGEWALLLVGILSVILGVTMAVQPGVGLLSLVWVVGLYALLAGAALIALAFRVRDAGHRGSRVV